MWLPSGGSLVIDRTEAMTVIDVNTGKFTGQGGNLEETVTRNNLEAAEEIVRQLRLRDVGGIVVIDFIDMVLESNRELVLRRLLECLARDRTKHQVAEVTSLGLVQMTRKRVGAGLLEAFSQQCECCNGRGVIVTLDAPAEPAHRASAGTAHRPVPAPPSHAPGNGNGNGRVTARATPRPDTATAAAVTAAATMTATTRDTPRDGTPRRPAPAPAGRRAGSRDAPRVRHGRRQARRRPTPPAATARPVEGTGRQRQPPHAPQHLGGHRLRHGRPCRRHPGLVPVVPPAADPAPRPSPRPRPATRPRPSPRTRPRPRSAAPAPAPPWPASRSSPTAGARPPTRRHSSPPRTAGDRGGTGHGRDGAAGRRGVPGDRGPAAMTGAERRRR